MSFIEIDGAAGEGGGQVLRSALALSLITQRPFRIRNIRAGRSRPGLLRQHLTAVQAAAAIGHAQVEGAALGSKSLTFIPDGLFGGEHHFAIGTAGSTSLVLQAVLPALLMATTPSHLVLEGGTHNPAAPPFDFLEQAFLPLLTRMGARFESRLHRRGFFPAGGGKLEITIHPPAQWTPLYLAERGAALEPYAEAICINLPSEIASRELAVVAQEFRWAEAQLRIRGGRGPGPGNALLLVLPHENVTEVITALGAFGVPAEQVAAQAIQEARVYLHSDAAVGEHLADQLLLPMALAGSGHFSTTAPSMHTRTNRDIIEMFLPVRFTIEPRNEQWWIEVSS